MCAVLRMMELGTRPWFCIFGSSRRRCEDVLLFLPPLPPNTTPLSVPILPPLYSYLFFFPFCLVARKRREAKEKKTHAQSKETPNY